MGRKKQKHAAENTLVYAASNQSHSHNLLIHVTLICVLGLLVYSNTLSAPFVFDDDIYIVNNPIIRDFGHFIGGSALKDLRVDNDVKNNFITRPITYLSFALNYKMNGLDVPGYHLFNILVHIANALLVYRLMSLTLKTGFFRQQTGENVSSLVPLFAALLFVSHPVQTQAVTYLIQRATSLATFFYLSALVLYIQSRLAEAATPRNALYAVSLISAVIAMETKEISFTLPIMTALYEFLFFSGNIRERLLRLLPMFMTMLIIPLTVLHITSPDNINAHTVDKSLNLINFGHTSPWHYLITQFGVITTYIRLLFWPVNQNLDYDYPLLVNLFSVNVLLPLSFLLLICGVAFYFLNRSRIEHNEDRHWSRLAFAGIAWFFIALSVESSVIPIEDLIFEHRIYLPSVGMIVAVLSFLELLALKHMKGKNSATEIRKTAIVIMAVAVLSVMCFARNNVWASGITLWEDVTRKSPGKARPHNNLGHEYAKQGRLDAAAREFQLATQADPAYITPFINRGNVFVRMKRFDDAIAEFRKVLAMNPKDIQAHKGLGYVYFSQGRLDEAAEEFNMTLSANPDAGAATGRNPDVTLDEEELYEQAMRNFQAIKAVYPKMLLPAK